MRTGICDIENADDVGISSVNQRSVRIDGDAVGCHDRIGVVVGDVASAMTAEKGIPQVNWCSLGSRRETGRAGFKRRHLRISAVIVN